MRATSFKYAVIWLTISIGLRCQSAAPFQAEPQPIYKVTVVSRTLPAINYGHLNGPTSIDFSGTVLLPHAKGSATVESKRGRVTIDAKFYHLDPPTRYGTEYLTYVLWAITPEGRPKNLGELVADPSDKAKISVTTDLQALGMMVTAEPYYSVTSPSDVVVLENVVRPDTAGTIRPVLAKYELLPRGQYHFTVSQTPAVSAGQQKLPYDRYEAVLEVYQAQNAIQMAQAAGADRFASDTLGGAKAVLNEAQNLQLRKQDTGMIISRAREAAQMAEDARVIAVKSSADEHMAQVQQQQTDESRAKVKAESEAREAVAAADAAREQAARERVVAQRATAQAELERRQRQAQQPPQPPPAITGEAASTPAQMTGVQRQTRASILDRLSSVLPTMDTPRGLVIILPNAWFDTTTGTLRQWATERLAQAAVTLSSRPDLTAEVKGFTDDRGSQRQLQNLSQMHAEAVRAVLTGNGVVPGAIHAIGLGHDRPIASNATPTGREQNRRVEIVIAGPSIGNLALWDRTYDLSARH